jgi:hypothetical protein
MNIKQAKAPINNEEVCVLLEEPFLRKRSLSSMIDVAEAKRIYHLCQQYTPLSEEDIRIIIGKSEALQMIADVSQANVFIDCPVKDRSAVIVVAEAAPTTTHSLYKESVVGKEVFESYEPGVFRL